MKLSIICLSVLLATSACQPEEKPVKVENKSAVIPSWKLPGVEAKNERYWFCNEMDTAFQHPLSVKVLNLRDSIGPKEAKRLISGLPKLKNLNTLWISGQPNLNLEPLFEVLQSSDSLKELRITRCNLNILGKIKRLKRIKTLYLDEISIQKVHISFLDDMKLKSLTIIGHKNGFSFSGKLHPGNSLEELIIVYNNEKEINQQLLKLNNLQALSISASAVSSISPSITSLLKLKTLEISFTPLSKDEAKITKLRQLLKGKCTVLTEQDMPPPPH